MTTLAIVILLVVGIAAYIAIFMSDKDSLTAMLKAWNVPYDTYLNTVIINVDKRKITGYSNNQVVFVFSLSGKFERIEIWP